MLRAGLIRVLSLAGALALFATARASGQARALPAGRPADTIETIPGLMVPPRALPAADLPAPRVQELSVETLVNEVLARNPTLAEMAAAWQAAQARYPQVTSLEDPMFAATIGPGTIAPEDPGIHFAYRLEIAQKLPYPGKLHLRGDRAQAEASAAGHDVDDTRLQLIESARQAYYDYYLVDRALAVNAEGLRLLHDFRQNADTRYVNGQAPQQDILQADVEIGRQREREIALRRMRTVALARLNTLRHQPPEAPLPPPPTDLKPGNPLPEAATLRVEALSRRPDLQAEADRLRAEEAALALAHKDFYPDFEPFFMYDRFMGNMPENKDLASMLGVRLNLPVYQGKRCGAVAEAQARIAQRRAALARLTDQVSFQVEEAHARVQESERTVHLYEQTILPAAQRNVQSAQAAYVTSKVPFLSLIEAERSLVELRDRYYEAVADSFRRRATLERVVGGPLP